MRRRALLRGVAALAVATTGARAQSSPRVVGILMPYSHGDVIVQARVDGFRNALAELGWRDGDTVRFDLRWPGDDLEKVRRDAAELVERGVDAILTTGSRVVPIVQRQTRTIPIVFVGTSDPVGQGFVAALARPGGNTTGFSLFEFAGDSAPVIGKMLELLRQIAPATSRAALVFNPDNPATAIYASTFTAAGRALGVAATALPLRRPEDLRAAISAFATTPGAGLVFPSDLTLLANRALVTGLAAELRVPAIFADTAFAVAGGLAAYSPDRADMFKRAARYVDRIFRGESPGDLPVQQPTRYELVINLRSAAGLGLVVPPVVLALADEVIE
ncbi:MAG: ABC transporter substrate-binding protein [Alphaproteobacteria bacterium]|nr:ABC transporter substrate-binding protein [Alphaproteobacteria bacterium]